MSNSVNFQEYSHDPRLGGSSSEVDGGPALKRNRAHLAPKIFHENTTDKSVDWFFEEALGPLVKLLEEVDE